MVQRCAARYVTNRYHNTSSVTDMMNHLKWEPLQERRTKLRLAMTYKIVHGLVAIPLEELFERATVKSHCNHAHKLVHQTATTDYLKYSFAVRTVPVWNQLDKNLAEATSLPTFRLLLAKAELPRLGYDTPLPANAY